MTWQNIFNHVDKHNLDWGKASANHIEPKHFDTVEEFVDALEKLDKEQRSTNRK